MMAGPVKLTESEELALIEKVELRLALAETEKQFEKNLEGLLAPLLLKLSSTYSAVRQAVLKLLQFISQRFSSWENLKLPVEKLVQQAKTPNLDADVDSTLVRSYSLLFASKSVDRLDTNELMDLVPVVLNGMVKLPESIRPRMFYLLCKLLLQFEESSLLSSDYNEAKILSHSEQEDDHSFWMSKFTLFFLLLPQQQSPNDALSSRYRCPGLSYDDVAFFTKSSGVSFNSQQLNKFRRAIFRFVVNGIVEENNTWLFKFLIVASADTTSLRDQAIQTLKRFRVPYEDRDFISFLIILFCGHPDGHIGPVSHTLQLEILSTLKKSIVATSISERMLDICQIGLQSTTIKVRLLTLSFIQHVSRHNYSSLSCIPIGNEESCANYVCAVIKQNIKTAHSDLQLQTSQNIQERKAQYETLSELFKREYPFQDDMSTIELLFDYLSKDLPELRVSIQETLSALVGHLPSFTADSKDKLRTIIEKILVNSPLEHKSSSSSESIMARKYMAIKFVNASFPFNDANARMLNILGTSRSNRFDVIEESFKGLHPHWFRVLQSSNSKEFKPTAELLATKTTETQFVSFESLLYLIEDMISKADEVRIIRDCLNTAVSFAFQCLVSNAVEGHNTIIVQDQDWSLRIEKAVETDEKVYDLVKRGIHGLSSEFYINFLTILVNEFVKKDETGKFVSIFRYSDPIFGKTLLTLIKHSSDIVISKLGSLSERIFRFVQTCDTASDADIASAANILGIIGAYHNSPFYASLLEKLNESSLLDKATLYAGSYYLPRLAINGNANVSLSKGSYNLSISLVQNLKDSKFKKASYQCLCELAKFGLFNSLSSNEKKHILDELCGLLKDVLLNNEPAILLWCYLALYVEDAEKFDFMFQTFQNIHMSKQTEFLFTSGEALTVLLGGWSSKFLVNQLDVKAYSAKLTETFPGTYLLTGLSSIISYSRSIKPALRKASCLWLLSIAQYLDGRIEILNLCEEIHLAFMRFLADRDELIQESASRGLSIIYGLAKADFREDMVKGLLKSFTDSAKTISLSSGTLSEETTLFAPGTLDTGDGYISTYKDILNLANEVGDVSLVYKFMDLAKSSTLWSSRKGVAFGLGAIISKNSLQEMLLNKRNLAERLIPKLFRYRFDPQKNVAGSMNDIWNTLVSDPATTIKQYFNEIVSDLLTNMRNNEWRVREASTNALIDLVQTSSIEEYQLQLENIWTETFRVMDDIKETVREAGSKLALVLSKVLVRSIDESRVVDSKKSRHILDVLLPFLIGSKGFHNDAEEVRKFALQTLLDLIKNAGGTIKPYAPSLVYELTVSLSFLEPQLINYLSLNADKYNISTEDIDARRAQTLNNSSIMSSIEKLIDLCDESLMQELVDYSTKAVKKSVGLPSKVASSKVISLLALKYHISLRPFTGKFMKICFNSYEDRNNTISNAFATTFGYIFRVSALDKAVKYSNKMVTKFFEADETGIKMVIGTAIESVQRHGTEQFEGISSILMPLIFIAMNNPDDNLSTLYTNIWNESSSSGSGTMKLYVDEISTLVAKYISSNDFSTRQMCAKSISKLCWNMDSNLSKTQISKLFDILLSASKGKSWDGKDLIVGALTQVCVNFEDFYSHDIELQSQVKYILQVEISRNNKSYVTKISAAYCKYLAKYPDTQLVNKLMEAATSILRSLEASDDLATSQSDLEAHKNPSKRSKMDVSKKSSKENIQNEELRIKILKEVTDAVVFKSSNQENELLSFVIGSIINMFEPSSILYTWRTQLAGCELGIKLISNSTQNPEDYLKSDVADSFERLWKTLYSFNSTVDTIESVKIQLIRFGAKLKSKLNASTVLIESNLRDLVMQDNSPILNAELRNANIRT